jgi:N-dimethylarginine dimethylaminohydrolase
MEDRLYHHDEIDFIGASLEKFQYPKILLMVTPAYFDVVDVRNAYMEDNIGKIHYDTAWDEWNTLHALYHRLILKGCLHEVKVMDGQPGLVDMVFAANQSLPWINRKGDKVVILSRMRNANRQLEVPFFQSFYDSLGYVQLDWPESILLEGNGDIIAHPGRRLIWAGYGHRSSFEAAALLPSKLETPVIPLKLISEKFYHLDTCFMPLDDHSVLICPSAFDDNSLKAIAGVFEEVIFIPESEAETTFALNGLVLQDSDGVKHVIIQEGAAATISALKEKKCEVHEVNTDEFMKSGGSVFCMKMMLY